MNKKCQVFTPNGYVKKLLDCIDYNENIYDKIKKWAVARLYWSVLWQSIFALDDYSEFEKSLSGTGIVFPKPIKELSLIENLIENGKTIWESGSKLLIDAQNSFADVIAKIIKNK